MKIIPFLNIGFGEFAYPDHVLAVLSMESPRTRALARDRLAAGMASDMTNRRRRRSLIVADSGHMIISFLRPKIVVAGINLEEHR